MESGSGGRITMRKHLKEIPASSRNSPNWTWDSKKSSDLLSGMGVTPMEKDPLDTENTPLDQISTITPPVKRQKPKEKDDTFVIARRPRAAKTSSPGISWLSVPDELFLGIFSYLHLTDLVKVSRVCKRWRRLACDESLWYSLDLTGKHLLDGVVGKLLSRGVVVLRCPRTCIGDPMFQQIRPLRLQYVDLSHSTIGIDALLSIISRCHRLQNLSLEGLSLDEDIISAIAQNSDLVKLNIGGCFGFSAESLAHMLRSLSRLDELNLSWCDFTANHVKSAMENMPRSLTQLNISGYRQNLELADVEALVQRCPYITVLDLSDSVLLTPDCFPVFQQLLHLQNLGLSRCYHITPASLLDLEKQPSLKTLSVYGIVTDNALQLLKESLPNIKINSSFYSTVARPTTGPKKSREIWGIKCKLTFNRADC